MNSAIDLKPLKQIAAKAAEDALLSANKLMPEELATPTSDAYVQAYATVYGQVLSALIQTYGNK